MFEISREKDDKRKKIKIISVNLKDIFLFVIYFMYLFPKHKMMSKKKKKKKRLK